MTCSIAWARSGGINTGWRWSTTSPKGDEPRFETPSFRRSNAWEATAREVRAVREGVGINEVHNFGKYLVTGPNARDWLDRIMAGRIPKPGRLALTPMLSPKGRLWGDFTVSCLGDETFQLTASYGAQAVHMRWFEMNEAEGVRVENISDRLNGFQIAGPRARDVLPPAPATGWRTCASWTCAAPPSAWSIASCSG